MSIGDTRTKHQMSEHRKRPSSHTKVQKKSVDKPKPVVSTMSKRCVEMSVTCLSITSYVLVANIL